MSKFALFAFIVVASPAIAITGPARVVDGDTIRIGTTKIRLHGIDAPERDQTCKRLDLKPYRCGTQSIQYLSNLLADQAVDCTALSTDRYGRTIASCRVNSRDVGESMVRSGWAVAYRKYSGQYIDAERSAQSNRVGMWSGSFVLPWHYRQQKRTASAQAAPDSNCNIKGNINRKGRRIYHMPGSRSYAATRINTKRGERWFCSKQEACQAGWRPAR